MKRKNKSTAEPSLRAKLSADFLAAIQNDFQQHGADVIQQLREKHPDKYASIAASVIAQTEPPGDPNDLSRAKSSADVARIQLQGIGLTDPSDGQIEQAQVLISEFLTRLEMIAASDVSLEAFEERELRQ